MNIRETQRASRISTIKKSLETAKEQGRRVDETKLVKEIMLQFGVTKRTAEEYVEIAGFKNDNNATLQDTNN